MKLNVAQITATRDAKLEPMLEQMKAEARTRWRTSGTWRAASTHRCSPTRGWWRPSRPGEAGRRCRCGRTDGVGRFSRELEAALYFCALEALQNVARHAPGSAVRVSLAEDEGQVVFSVTDDGPGFDPATGSREPGGSGLQNMRDRLAALGRLLPG